MLGASGFLVEEQGYFNLLLENGTSRACFKTYELQARKDSNPTTILFYFIVFCLMCITECITAEGYAKNKVATQDLSKKLSNLTTVS